MKTISKKIVKCVILFVVSTFSFTSCIYYEESYSISGKAYVRLNWNNRQPDYIATDGIVPSNFYWNTYYRAIPGYYTVHYEYDYDNGYKTVTYAYDANVEVWINHGEKQYYNGVKAADSYFDMELYPDGGYDFTAYSQLKSNIINENAGVKFLGTIDSITTVQNGITMKIIYKRVEPVTTRIKK